jgi:hypothetical protein
MKTKTVRITLQLPVDIYNDLVYVAERCTRIHKAKGGGTSHGDLDATSLLLMLAEDAAMANSRPGSWEGTNLQQVLDAHGYVCHVSENQAAPISKDRGHGSSIDNYLANVKPERINFDGATTMPPTADLSDWATKKIFPQPDASPAQACPHPKPSPEA